MTSGGGGGAGRSGSEEIVPILYVGSPRQHLLCRGPTPAAGPPLLTRGTSGKGMMSLMKPAWSDFL